MAGKRRPALAAFVLSLLLHVGDVTSSNYGYVEWSDQDGDPEVTTKPEAQVTTERTVLAHKIEEDLPRVVTAFLHTGDSSTLRRAPCSRRYELSSLRGGPRLGPPHHALHGVLDGVVHATGFLTAFLQSNGSRAHDLRQNWRWYHALIQSLLEGDARIRRAVVTVNTEVTSPGPHLFLQATRVDGEVTLQDLSATAGRLLRNRTAEWDWFTEFRDRAKLHLRRKAKGGDGPSPERSHVKWSAPFLDCENGSFIPHWLLTLSAGLYSLRPNLAPEFRGVVRVDVNLQDVDIDQCSSKGWFAGTHRCNMSTMECKPILGYGFVLDKYKCHCRKGFYHPSSVSVNGLQRREKPPISLGSVQEEEAAEAVGICLPCQEGCAYCKDDTPCLAQEDGHLRVALLCLQGLCVLSVCICMLLVYRFRRNKRIRASGLVLLEVILAGSLLLYMPEMMLYLQPGVLRCVLLRWLRLLGFATVYGTVILKLYRVLKVFLSRTAQRIPYMTSWRVLRLLAFILLVVCWFLVAWTSAVCQDLERGLSPIEVGFTPEGLQFSMCLLDRWDYMMAVAEVLFLLWGVYLCYAVRTVPSAFHEPRYLAVAIYNELIISAVFHVIRFTLAPGLHPDWLLMLFFAHTQLTVTVTLGLLLVPKFLFAGTPARDDIATEAYEDELDMGRSGSYLNSSITSAWSEHSLDPEDIREELKKLYAQLEIYKRKKMLANNPHLQKKRSSKKGLGRSLMKRITEIPETMSRQCNREDKDVGDHGFSRNSLCTLRRSPHDTSHLAKQKEDSLKNKVFSLKKSHSTYDHVRDQSQVVNTPANDKMEVSTTESSLLDTLMGKKLAKKSLEKVEGESTESVPLVCKSASAHNLTIEKKPIHLRTSMLQKSLSVIANAKEKTLGLTAKTHGVEDSSKKGPNKNKENVAVTDVNETSECYPKMIISQSVEYRQTPNKTGNMKHQVSGSQPSICSESGRNKDLYDLSEVCPWEVEDLPTPSENKIQKHVSIAPREATTIHGGGPKMKMQQRQKVLDRQSSTSKRSNQKTAERQNLSTKEEAVESHGIKKGVKPQVPLNLSMNPSNKANLCSWDFEETTDKMDASCSPEKFRRKKSVTPTEGKCKSLHSDHSKSTGSLLGPPVSRADICTWDYEARPTTGSEQTQVLKVKESHFKKKGSSTKGSEREKIKEKDEEKRKSKSKDKASSKATEKRRVSQSKAAEIGPRDAATNEPASANSKADVCPWDFPDVSGSKEQNHRHSAGNGSAPAVKGGLPSNAQLADVCPWDCDDTISGKHA